MNTRIIYTNSDKIRLTVTNEEVRIKIPAKTDNPDFYIKSLTKIAEQLSPISQDLRGSVMKGRVCMCSKDRKSFKEWFNLTTYFYKK